MPLQKRDAVVGWFAKERRHGSIEVEQDGSMERVFFVDVVLVVVVVFLVEVGVVDVVLEVVVDDVVVVVLLVVVVVETGEIVLDKVVLGTVVMFINLLHLLLTKFVASWSKPAG